jgi:hypothetical protein
MVMTNLALRRIYKLCPAIAAWATSDCPFTLWPTRTEACVGIQEYIGPRSSPLYAQSLHLEPGDVEFLRSLEAFSAIIAAIGALYDGDTRFRDGLFLEAEHAQH